MQVDGEESSQLQFRPIPYTIETDETEMIAINYVAKGAGSAAAVRDTEPAPKTQEQAPADKKGKKRADASEDQGKPAENESTNVLTNEEEDQIAGITTRLNSVKMLQSRLTLLTKYLQTQPPSYLSDIDVPLSPTSPDPAHLSHLREIQALLTHLSLLTPPQDASSAKPLDEASKSQANDVNITSLLALLGQNVQGMSELGRKSATVEQAKGSKGKGKGGFGNNSLGGMEDYHGGPPGLINSGGMKV